MFNYHKNPYTQTNGFSASLDLYRDTKNKRQAFWVSADAAVTHPETAQWVKGVRLRLLEKNHTRWVGVSWKPLGLSSQEATEAESRWELQAVTGRPYRRVTTNHTQNTFRSHCRIPAEDMREPLTHSTRRDAHAPPVSPTASNRKSWGLRLITTAPQTSA